MGISYRMPFTANTLIMNQAQEARQLLRTHRYGVLSTLSKKYNGHPFGSIIQYLVDQDGSLLILISNLAEHTKNIINDARISLITHDQNNSNILTQGRVTVIGNALPEPDRELVALRYIRYFPEASTYLAMQDFSFYRIQPMAIRFISGFGKIHWLNMDNYTVKQAGHFSKQEVSLLKVVNSEKHEELSHLLRLHLEIDAIDVKAIGIDCDGLDLRYGEQTLRVNLPEAAITPSLEVLLKSI
jgi:heme iron utilization protein